MTVGSLGSMEFRGYVFENELLDVPLVQIISLGLVFWTFLLFQGRIDSCYLKIGMIFAPSLSNAFCHDQPLIIMLSYWNWRV